MHAFLPKDLGQAKLHYQALSLAHDVINPGFSYLAARHQLLHKIRYCFAANLNSYS
jgi:hypothetical protein